MNVKVVEKQREELCWGFDNELPTFKLGEHGGYATSEKVDPFPAYPHNRELLKKEIKRVTDLFPIEWPVTFYSLPCEVIGRTNAFTQASSFDYSKKLENVPEGKEQYSRCPFIVFSGKRIPIMPAMTRYLVAHEYGHVIEDWIAYKRGIKDYELLEEYRELRQVPKNPISYGGGWHRTIGEIFANDFRIVITGTELEFWPHECKPPYHVKEVIDWWYKAREEYSYAV